MPKESVNLYLSIQSGSSEQTLVSLTDKTRALDKETQLLAQATDVLTKANKPLMEEQKKLQDKIKDSEAAIKGFRKAYEESEDELSKLSLNNAIEEHAKLKAELSGVNAQINTNQKTYKEYLETVRKGALSNPGADAGGDNGTINLSAVWSGLDIGKQLSAVVEQAGGALLESALGSDTGSIASSALSGSITGASLGTAIAPGIGTAIGAAVGGAFGTLSGAMEQWSNKDDAFKDYYGGLYDDVKERAGEMVEAGSALSSTRESDLRSLSTLLDGDTEAAERFQAVLIEIGRTPPFSYDSVAALSKSMIGLGLSTDDITDRIAALGEAAAALDLSESGVTTIASTLESIQLSGKLETRVLKTLSKQGINVYEALADEFGMTEADVVEQLGELDTERAIQAIYGYMGSHFAGASDGLTDTYSGASGILASYKEDTENTGGEAYNRFRKEGIQAQINAYEGELGDALKEINAVIGESQARKENLQDQYMRQVLEAVMLGKQGSLWSEFDESQRETLTQMSEKYAEFKSQWDIGDKNAGAELESLYEQAQVLGQAYFDNSDEMARLNDIEQDEIEAIRDATVGLSEATQAAYNLRDELSKGRAAVKIEFDFSDVDYSSMDWVDEGGNVHYADTSSLSGWYDDGGNFHPDDFGRSKRTGGTAADVDSLKSRRSHAFGLDRVPYDEYPALLHDGERVLTASQARAQDAGQVPAPINITITGNTFTGAGEELADQIAEVIVRRLEQAAVAAGR